MASSTWKNILVWLGIVVCLTLFSQFVPINTDVWMPRLLVIYAVIILPVVAIAIIAKRRRSKGNEQGSGRGK